MDTPGHQEIAMNQRGCILLSLALAGVLAISLAGQEKQGKPDSTENDRLIRIASQAGSGVHWIADPYHPVDRGRSRRGSTQPSQRAVDRGVLLDAALARAKVSRRLVLLYAFRFAGGHMYRAPVLDDYMNLAVFSDPELVALINRKFVPLRLYVDPEVGKRLEVLAWSSRDRLFLKNVEPALLFLDPRGKVLHVVQRIRTFSVPWVRRVVKEVLRSHAKYDEPSLTLRAVETTGRSAGAMVYLAGEQCLDGKEEAALEILDKATKRIESDVKTARKRLADREKAKPEKDADARAVRRWALRVQSTKGGLDRALVTRGRWLVARARALRLLRRGQEALPALDQAVAEVGDADLKAALALEAARIRMALGDWAGAGKSLEDAPPCSETAFLRGAACFNAWQIEAAGEHFRRAVAFGESPFNRRAAAMLAVSADTTPLSPLAHGFTLLEYGPEAAYARGVPATSEMPRAGSARAARATVARAAFDYLLKHQRPDGSWSDTRYAFWPAPRILPNVRMAVTALAAAAVISWWDLDPDRAEKAVVKAERYLRDDGRVAEGTEEEVYTQAYRILYWVRKAAASPASRSEAIKQLNALARRADKIQQPTTGLFMHEYYNAFCTGTMLWSLHLARETGAEVRARTLEQGVKALESARREDGSFVYGGVYRSRRAGNASRENVTNLKNSMGRMPHCEGVLLALGASDQARLAKAFKVFLKYLDRLERVRKCDFHADDQLGGFFFWHAVFHASEARALLEGPLRKKVDEALLELVTHIPEIDGSFIDDHELGKSYGTAMALLVLKNLESENRRREQ